MPNCCVLLTSHHWCKHLYQDFVHRFVVGSKLSLSGRMGNNYNNKSLECSPIWLKLRIRLSRNYIELRLHQLLKLSFSIECVAIDLKICYSKYVFFCAKSFTSFVLTFKFAYIRTLQCSFPLSLLIADEDDHWIGLWIHKILNWEFRLMCQLQLKFEEHDFEGDRYNYSEC